MTSRLTSTPAEVALSRLSPELYEDFLATAQSSGFACLVQEGLADEVVVRSPRPDVAPRPPSDDQDIGFGPRPTPG